MRGARPRGADARTLDVDIPAGIADEQRIRITGRGHAGDRGGPAGDLYVLVRVTQDERFVRDGNDLVTVIDLPAPQAALGAKVTVPTLDGEEELEIEPGTQPGSVITHARQGHAVAAPRPARGPARGGERDDPAQAQLASSASCSSASPPRSATRTCTRAATSRCLPA